MHGPLKVTSYSDLAWGTSTSNGLIISGHTPLELHAYILFCKGQLLIDPQYQYLPNIYIKQD